MRTYDFSPLWRYTIGFDRLFDLAEMAQHTIEDNYPPYNTAQLGEDRYQISLALAGFAPEEITLTAEQNVLMPKPRRMSGPLCTAESPTGRSGASLT